MSCNQLRRTVHSARSRNSFAASVFCHLSGWLFLALGGCVIVPTVNTTTHAVTCCSAYATYFGYDFSSSYAKAGNQWNAKTGVSWKYLYGP